VWIGRQRYFLGLFVFCGVLTMMLALGALIAALAVPIGRTLAYLIPVVDFVILLLGLSLLLHRNPFKVLPQFQIPLLRHPFLNAYAYGLLYGPLTLPCTGPLVVSVFALSLTLGEAFDKLAVVLWFSIGFGLPLLMLSILSGALQRQLAELFAHHNRMIYWVGGLLLVGIAIYDLAQNWTMLRLFYF